METIFKVQLMSSKRQENFSLIKKKYYEIKKIDILGMKCMTMNIKGSTICLRNRMDTGKADELEI